MAFKSKITAEQVEEIRSRRAAGEKYAAIAEDYEISASRVYELCNPEKQAAKKEYVKAWNARRKEENANSKAVATAEEEEEAAGLDLSNFTEDGYETDYGTPVASSDDEDEYEDEGEDDDIV